MEPKDPALEDLMHQLRGPLVAAIHRLASLLDHDSPPPMERELRAIRGLCQKANRIAGSAGLFSLLHSQGASLYLYLKVLRPSDLIKLLLENASDAQVLLDPSRGIKIVVDRLSVDYAGDFSADPLLVGQAVANLLDNAAKYSYAGTVIDISAKRTRTSFRIIVCNQGISITNDEVPLCTKRGWRGEQAMMVTGEGSGIGLWIVDHIMKAHGGSVQVSPTDVSGKTRVALAFPIKEAA